MLITTIPAKKPLLSTVVLCMVLTGCGSDRKSTTPAPVTAQVPVTPDTPATTTDPITSALPTTGIWSAPAYGYVLVIEDQQHGLYQHTSEYCQRLGLDEVDQEGHQALVDSIVLSDDQDSMVTTIAGQKVPGMAMTRLAALPDSCADSLLPQAGEEGYVFNPQQDFEIFWQTFNEQYAFFGLEGVNWDEVYQLANSQINESTSREALFEILKQMIAPLKDFHVSLTDPVLEQAISFSRKQDFIDILMSEYLSINHIEPPFTQAMFADFIPYLIKQRQNSLMNTFAHMADIEQVNGNDNDSLLWGITADNLGYLYIETMDLEEIGDEDATRDENMYQLRVTMDEVLSDLEDIDGLIIDVRYNGGGNDYVSQYIASRLIKQDLYAYAKQVRLGDGRTPMQPMVIKPLGIRPFTGPVALLTSTETGSAAEVFTMTLRERPDTMLIGEATAGGLSDTLDKSLPGGFVYTLSNEIYLTPAGEAFEGVGVPVDFEVPFFTLEQREKGVDWGMEKAITELMGNKH
ncbi:MAG: carboxyl-terminal processing protease [Phenylobacterium sp.]|jgi:carboxyl-terminal processing protease